MFQKEHKMSETISNRIQGIINENPITLFMKGTRDMPMCGFSSAVVQILNHMDVDYKEINVLEDDEIRQGIKDFSDWPTIPQLYVDQEFIGGCDIVREMYMSGELKELLASKEVKAV